MPGNDPFQSWTENTPAEQFKNDRLDRESIDVTQYPAQVDRAAVDIMRDIAVGETGDVTDIGGTVDKWNFDEATGQFYVEGLTAIAGPDSTLAENLAEYNENTIGQLAFQLNSLRHTLQTTGEQMDIDRALEAILEKKATVAIERSLKPGGNAGAGLRPLRDTDSVSDLTARLFSDPRVDAYAQVFVNLVLEEDADRDELVTQLDEARMTTPLWNHQREALKRWHENNQSGYVDMATATGKTVLGLAALALRYGSLHPTDTTMAEALTMSDDAPDVPDQPKVLVVAGNKLLLDQWRAELDEHLNIPSARTTPVEDSDHQTIELEWGEIEFRTAPSLLSTDEFSRYDLVILDEAHRYSRGRAEGRGWGDLFTDLTDGAHAVLALSGSIDSGWTGDSTAKSALEDHLTQCYKFDVAKARQEGVIADFSWQIRYLPVTGDQVDRLKSQTRITTANYDSASGTLDAANLNVSEADLPEEVVDYDELRSFVQSNDGSSLRSESTAFDAFASALLARKPLRWNTSPDTDAIAALVAKHAPDQKTVVLVRSYEASKNLEDVLTEQYGLDRNDIVTFTNSSEDRLEKVEQFNEGHRGVIIGPGDLLGTGVDMPDAEVAVNVSSGGVNASLVQRIGRVLRNPTGEKDAQFYHLVAQPLDVDAIDAVEDGGKLLERAAEFRALGETFRETPTFRAHDDVASTLVRLENSGVTLLERIDEENRLVDDATAHKFIRVLQAAVYDATAEADDPDSRGRPVLEEWVTERTTEDSETDTDRLFPERNEAYERYRLTLGPYRAAKAVASHLYGSTVEPKESDGSFHVEFDDDTVAGTAFHDALEQWLNRYRGWRDHCDNRDGDGEPGSLPEYKTEWPEPPEDDGVMLPREVVNEIGVSYADADPIFFPYVDGEVYTLPLPDGRYLTIEGIVEDLEAIDETKTERSADEYTVDSLLLTAVRAQEPDVDEFVSVAVADLLKEAIETDLSISAPERGQPRTQLDVNLPARHENLLNALANDTRDVETVDQLIDVALRRRLDVEASDRSVQLSAVLANSIQAMDNVKSVDGFVNKAVRSKLRDEIGN